jgi:hypothetical protein
MADLKRQRQSTHRAFSPGTRRLQRQVREAAPYKVIAVGIYDDQAALLDRTAAELQEAGYLKANRSFVVQALVRRLGQEIEGLNSDQLLQLFFDSYLKRPSSRMLSRESRSRATDHKERSRRRRSVAG